MTSNVNNCSPSHGGRFESTSIGCYGNPKYPEDIGLASNIGSDSLTKTAVGGGAVKLSVTGACVIDGEISVDGAKANASGPLAAGAAGSILIEASTGRKADLILGKPFGGIVEEALMRTGFGLHELAMVGDRLYTDVATGVNHGMTGILVLSGEATMADVAASEVKPDLIFGRLADMIPYL